MIIVNTPSGNVLYMPKIAPGSLATLAQCDHGVDMFDLTHDCVETEVSKVFARDTE